MKFILFFVVFNEKICKKYIKNFKIENKKFKLKLAEQKNSKKIRLLIIQEF